MGYTVKGSQDTLQVQCAWRVLWFRCATATIWRPTFSPPPPDLSQVLGAVPSISEITVL